jgi:hypothetical protein
MFFKEITHEVRKLKNETGTMIYRGGWSFMSGCAAGGLIYSSTVGVPLIKRCVLRHDHDISNWSLVVPRFNEKQMALRLVATRGSLYILTIHEVSA